MGLFYRPADGVAADAIPFHLEGRYHIFYLKDYRNPETYGEGTPWFHVVTTDFVTFEDWGEAIARGTPDDQDLYVFTGSVIERDGRFWIFYTGHNPRFRSIPGRREQVVLRAVSDDLRTWRKDPDFALAAPPGYEPHDWRDPFVFWNEDAGEYHMLLAARRDVGPSRARGVIALVASRDLRNWEVRQPFYAPDRYYTHECPDLFRIGDWWYLVYSIFSDERATEYRMSRELAGPWLTPPDDRFDGPAWYAAKSVGDGERRYLIGWLATRAGDREDGGLQWGGNLVAQELVQRDDGTLGVRPPETVSAHFSGRQPCAIRPVLGEWAVGDGVIVATSPGRYAAATACAMPDPCLIDTRLRFEPGAAEFGLLLRCDPSLERYYELRLEPRTQRLQVDRWPGAGHPVTMLRRTVRLDPEQPIRLRVLADGECLVVYVNRRVVLSCRCTEFRDGQVGLWVNDGVVRFETFNVRQPA